MDKLFVEAKSNLDVKKAVEKAMKLLPKKVGIVSTAQHKHKLKEIKKVLEEKERGIRQNICKAASDFHPFLRVLALSIMCVS